MSASNFSACLAFVFQEEGGYVNDPRDSGGATNMGITIGTLSRWRGRRVGVFDVKTLQKHEAAAIYRKFYWEPICGDQLPPGVDLLCFDAEVNSGEARAARFLAYALALPASSDIDMKMAKGAAARGAARIIDPFCNARLSFLRGLPTWPHFGHGWSARVSAVRALAKKMAAR